MTVRTSKAESANEQRIAGSIISCEAVLVSPWAMEMRESLGKQSGKKRPIPNGRK